MSGEYINSHSIEEYWKKLQKIYRGRASNWQNLTKEEYEKIERSERTDSDNEYNQTRLGKETDVIDLAFYKYLPGRLVAYHVRIMHKDNSSEDHYFQIQLKEE